MSVKLKVKFTIEAQTLFALASKLLPIEDLSIEELAPEHARAIAKATQQVVLAKPQIKKVNRRGNNRFNPDKGVNKIILDMLADGKPHHVAEADGTIKEAGYSPNGMYSRIQRLQRHGLVFQPRAGLWQLTPKKEN